VKGLILESAHIGSLNVPTSLIPEIIRNLDDGMSKFRETLRFVESSSSEPAGMVHVLLIVHSVMTFLVTDTALSALSTFVTMFMLWTFYFVALEYRYSSGAQHELRMMHSQMNDSLIAMVSDVTSSIPRLRWRSDEAKRRLSDDSLRECEFHADLVRMLGTRTRGSKPKARNAPGISHTPPTSKLAFLPKVMSLTTYNKSMHCTSRNSIDMDVEMGVDVVDSPTTSSVDNVEVNQCGGYNPDCDELGIRSFKIISDRKVAVLAEPKLGAKVTDYLAPGDRFDVAEEHWYEGRRYFEMWGGDGFVSEVSRKHPEKLVVTEATSSSSAYVARALATAKLSEDYEM